MPVDEAITIAKQIAEALAEAHERVGDIHDVRLALEGAVDLTARGGARPCSARCSQFAFPPFSLSVKPPA